MRGQVTEVRMVCTLRTDSNADGSSLERRPMSEVQNCRGIRSGENEIHHILDQGSPKRPQ